MGYVFATTWEATEQKAQSHKVTGRLAEVFIWGLILGYLGEISRKQGLSLDQVLLEQFYNQVA